MRSLAVLVVLALSAQLSSCQFFSQLAQPQSLSFAIQPPPLQAAPGAAFFDAAPAVAAAPGPFAAPLRRDYAHRAVVLNAEREAQLPSNLLNPFYKNPRIAEALAKESWFTNEEMHVTDREAEKIPRQKIYSVLKNAGFVNRRRR